MKSTTKQQILKACQAIVDEMHKIDRLLSKETIELVPLPENIGVLYDEEHVDGEGGFHEEGMWITCITERPPGAPKGKVRMSARALRADGYDVPPFTGTPCPRCFPKEGGAQ